MTVKAGLFIPTLNAGPSFERLLEQIDCQSFPLTRKLVIDSSSSDDTAALAKQHGFEVAVIPKAEFCHGRTRQDAFQRLCGSVDYILYFTQDVLLHDNDSIRQLLAAFTQDEIGAAYGRQLPHIGASASAVIHRQFSYPVDSRIKRMEDRANLGLKAPFISDAFAAYRCRALEEIGGFPHDADTCEDIYVGAKLLLKGYAIAYEAEAKVYHSHDFSLPELFRRYAAIGRFYRREHWLIEQFGTSEKEGARLVQYQFRELLSNGGLLSAWKVLQDDAFKYLAYCYGRSAIF